MPRRTGVESSPPRVGKGTRIAPTARIEAHRVEIGRDVEVADHVHLRSPSICLSSGTRIGARTSALFTEALEIGDLGFIGPDCVLRGRSMRSGSHLYVGEHVTIGGGGAMGPRAEMTIGDATSIFAESYVNLSERVTMGTGSALSGRVTILTHGCWQPVLEGYPFSFEPVTIGNDVVVYYGSTILPGVEIGDGTLVAAHSLVRSSLPARCLAGGNPARVLQESYPPGLSADQVRDRVDTVLAMYVESLDFKGCSEVRFVEAGTSEVKFDFAGVSYRVVVGTAPEDSADVVTMLLRLPGEECDRQPGGDRTAVFDLGARTLVGYRDRVVEDLRDHLRRAGVRILDERPFQTLPPAALRDLAG